MGAPWRRFPPGNHLGHVQILQMEMGAAYQYTRHVIWSVTDTPSVWNQLLVLVHHGLRIPCVLIVKKFP